MLLAPGACLQDLETNVKGSRTILNPFPVFLWHARRVLPSQDWKDVTGAQLVE